MHEIPPRMIVTLLGLGLFGSDSIRHIKTLLGSKDASEATKLVNNTRFTCPTVLSLILLELDTVLYNRLEHPLH